VTLQYPRSGGDSDAPAAYTEAMTVTQEADTAVRERVVEATYPLFVRHGFRDLGTERILTLAGIGTAEFDSAFSSREELGELLLRKHEREWTIGTVEAGARAGGSTPEGRLLAIFDVLDEWFHRDDYEAGTFIKVLLEMGREHPLGRASVEHLVNVRLLVERLATEAQLRDTADFSRSWHILMKGSVIDAAEGNQDGARIAKQMARALIQRFRPAVSPSLPPEEYEIADGAAPLSSVTTSSWFDEFDGDFPRD
jgi:AcrR family transcriptional regulator